MMDAALNEGMEIGATLGTQTIEDRPTFWDERKTVVVCMDCAGSRS